MDREEIRVRVLQILRESELSEAEIAREVGVSRSAISAWRMAFSTPRAKTILQPAEALEARGGKRMQQLAEELRQLAEARGRLPRRDYFS